MNGGINFCNHSWSYLIHAYSCVVIDQILLTSMDAVTNQTKTEIIEFWYLGISYLHSFVLSLDPMPAVLIML